MKPWVWIIILLLLSGTIIGFIATAYLYTQKKTESPKTIEISGIMDINGMIPPGSSLILSERKAGSNETFHPFATSLVPKDGIEWIFRDAMTNSSYELEATLLKNGKEIANSSPIFVTAPASGETMTMNILQASATGTAVISGTIIINGYVPPSATINVEGKTIDSATYTTVAKNLPAQNNQFMSYTTAQSGQEYNVRAFLYNAAGTQIGSSTILTLTAPAENETLTVNSQETPPTTPTPPVPTSAVQPSQAPAQTNTAISGTIDFNGQAPPNSRITLFQRVTGTQNFQLAVDNISPSDNTTWTWNGATAGTTYDLIAILKQRQSNGSDQDISTSSTMTLAAPASNVTFTINSGFSLPAAGGTISVSCGNFNSGNQTWSATISFSAIPTALSYWYQIGTTNGGVQLTNFTQNASNNQAQAYGETLQNGVTYFARYAYSTVSNLQANSPQFSPFSQTTPLMCTH